MTPFVSLPTPDGIMLWVVLCHAAFNRDIHNMKKGSTFEERYFILAKDEHKALTKSEPLTRPLVNMWRNIDEEVYIEITANVFDLGSLIPARNSKYDGGRGARGARLEEFIDKVELSLHADRKKFRLGVCLIPQE